jgi:uncharacterized protein (DUF302 family)
MTIRKIEIERLSVTSSKPFEAVVAALEAAIGHPDMAQFAKGTEGARTFAELESTLDRALGRTGLMLFMKLDAGAVLRKETGLDTPKIVRFLIGNPLIMKEMVKHVPDAGSYAPVTVLVDERSDGVHVSYDKMASLLASYGNPGALAVARDLDSKVESLLRDCTGCQSASKNDPGSAPNFDPYMGGFGRVPMSSGTAVRRTSRERARPQVPL